MFSQPRHKQSNQSHYNELMIHLGYICCLHFFCRTLREWWLNCECLL